MMCDQRKKIANNIIKNIIKVQKGKQNVKQFCYKLKKKYFGSD